jgi:FAD/FMN-containing dehydrogenase
MTTMSGGSATIDTAAVDAFAASLSGNLINPESPNYNEVRSIWNAMIDKRPGLIARCANDDDVVRAVDFATANDLLVSVRGIGHNIAGTAVCDGGLMIDLSTMKSIRVDAGAKTARVEPGVTLGEMDAATQEYGLALPIGINSITGIAGLALGGGMGWLGRKYGMTCDNLISADVVTAAGEKIRASATENEDLFWGLRGGGGNFGVVTSFEFRLHPVGPEILSGLIVHPFKDARAVLNYYREFAAQAPDELTVWAVLRKAPPLPFLDEAVHGTEVVVLAAMYTGEMAEGEKALAPLREFGSPHADVIGPHPFAGWQTAFDPLLEAGARNYWKSHDFLELSDGLLDTLIGAVDTIPDPQSEIFIAQMGGAIKRVPAAATAYTHRDAEFIVNVHGRWSEASSDNKVISWCRDLFDKATPYATGGVYVNFMTEEETDRVREAYGSSYDRLVQLKNKYDPKNVFSLNQNIRPTA